MSPPNDRFEITPGSIPMAPRRNSSGCVWIGLSFGCLAVVLLACGGFVGTMFWGVTSVISSSEPYQDAVKAAQENPEVQALIGPNIEAGWMMTGKINMNNDDGTADLTIGVKGAKGTGDVHIQGTRTNGKWTYQVIEFSDGRGTKIDLNASTNPTSE